MTTAKTAVYILKTSFIEFHLGVCPGRYAGLRSFLVMVGIVARRRKARAQRMKRSQSLASLRHRQRHAVVPGSYDNPALELRYQRIQLYFHRVHLSRRICRVYALHDFLTHFALGHRDVVSALQVEPELRAVAEVAGQPECRVGGDRAAAVKDAGDAARRHAEIERQAVGAEFPAFEFAAQQPSGMNCGCHV